MASSRWKAVAASIASGICSGRSWSTSDDDAQADGLWADRAVDLDGPVGGSTLWPRRMRRIVQPIYAQPMGTAMLQTLIWRTGRVWPPKVAADAGWRRWRALLLSQAPLVVGVLALLCGGLWTIGEWADHRAQLRLAETNRFLDPVRSGPVADAWEQLRAAWRAEQARQDALLARIPSLAGRERARTLQDHQMFVLETIEEYRLQDDIEVVYQFLIRLAICVRMGSCDAAVAAAQLGPALWTFRDQHRHYFDFEYSGLDLDGYVETIAPRPAAPGNPASPRW
jgi:hypothetical protein